MPSVPTITPNGVTLVSSGSNFYQWYLNGAIINGAIGQVYTPSQSGNYTVVITDVNGCSNTSTPFNFTSTGINEKSTSENILIYPNPATEQINIVVISGSKWKIH